MESTSGKYFSIKDKRDRKYPIRIYTSGICRHEDEYLLLRIRNSYKICPGDWEWLTCSIRRIGLSNLKERLLSYVRYTLRLHTELEGRTLKVYPPHKWEDHEFKLTYVLYPILIEIERPTVHLFTQKFSEYRWLTWENILNFDRNNYFFDYVNHIKQWEQMI